MRFQQERRADTHGAFLLPHLRPSMRLLDCGCGGGSITTDLGALLTAGIVIGVDKSASQCRTARKLSRLRGLTNSFFECQDVQRLEFSDATFDVVFGNALLDHVGDIDGAVAEMVRVLKPSGLLALRSPDWTGLDISPPSREVRRCFEIYKQQVRANGGDLNVSSRFVTLLPAHGLVDVCIGQSLERHPDSRRLAAAVKVAICRPDAGSNPDRRDSIQRASSEFLRWAEFEAGTIAEPWVEATGVKRPAQMATGEASAGVFEFGVPGKDCAQGARRGLGLVAPG